MIITYENRNGKEVTVKAARSGHYIKIDGKDGVFYITEVYNGITENFTGEKKLFKHGLRRQFFMGYILDIREKA